MLPEKYKPSVEEVAKYLNLWDASENYVLQENALNKQDKFTVLKLKDLRDYERFKSIMIDFRAFYLLKEFNLKDIDRYIWQLGKTYFRNT